MTTLSTLDGTEVARLTRLETVIENGMQTFIEVGKALQEIRKGRLYRETHDTFEDYLQTRWQFSHQRASQLIQAAEVATMVAIPPKTERQAREFVPLLGEPALLNEAWEEAVDVSNGNPTAAVVKKAVSSRRISDGDREEIAQLKGQGKTQREIAAITGWSESAISKVLSPNKQRGRLPRRRQASTLQTRALTKIHGACREWAASGDEEYIPAPEVARRIRVINDALAFLTKKRETYKKEALNGSSNN